MQVKSIKQTGEIYVALTIVIPKEDVPGENRVAATPETVKKIKALGAIFEHALRVSAASLQHSLMIGDSYEADIKGAMNVQLDAVFYNPEQQNIPEKPTFEVTHLMELKGFL